MSKGSSFYKLSDLFNLLARLWGEFFRNVTVDVPKNWIIPNAPQGPICGCKSGVTTTNRSHIRQNLHGFVHSSYHHCCDLHQWWPNLLRTWTVTVPEAKVFTSNCRLVRRMKEQEPGKRIAMWTNLSYEMKLLRYLTTLLFCLLFPALYLAAPAAIGTSTSAGATAPCEQKKAFFDTVHNTH